jgi:(p)ppGpp synthase/HD superfamily hydrolase
MTLSQKFEEALVYASVVHGGQVRKATGIPYIAHLLGVASIAFEYGANEDEAIGALLHDAAEDAGGAARIDDIRVRFGEKVATIVEGCTDTLETPKPPWRERKEKYLAHLKETDSSTRLVSAADKLFNTRSILRELRQRGDAVWTRFSGGKKDRLWYYRALVSAFRQHGDHSDLIDELDRVVTEIEKLVREEGESPAVNAK